MSKHYDHINDLPKWGPQNVGEIWKYQPLTTIEPDYYRIDRIFIQQGQLEVELYSLDNGPESEHGSPGAKHYMYDNFRGAYWAKYSTPWTEDKPDEPPTQETIEI